METGNRLTSRDLYSHAQKLNLSKANPASMFVIECIYNNKVLGRRGLVDSTLDYQAREAGLKPTIEAKLKSFVYIR
ncbi:hypothetical protein CEXT_544521 [Caerostris extrusa]|uniref:Uncharacterized protein n=1 Tax=Caerostris extrusa TaxID=172846 RepID=A0AAV4MWQ2_CAEEX|nr:hypothetical protein CEXT_544521 [Caerostris extrusa]